MRKYAAFHAIVALFVLLLFTTKADCFAGADDIKARMQERLPTIVEMKTEGSIGENNRGYLDFVPGVPRKMENIVTDENRDREMVYSAIAKQQSTSEVPVTKELVGERRAIQIAEKAKSGEWLQDATGKWYKK